MLRRTPLIVVIATSIFFAAVTIDAAAPLLIDINNSTAAASSNPVGFISRGSRSYFVATSDGHSALWSTDGTGAGTHRVFEPFGFVYSGPSLLYVVNGRVVVLGYSPFGEIEIWSIDASEHATLLRRLPRTYSVGGYAASASSTQLRLFLYQYGVGWELWNTNGVTATFVRTLPQTIGTSTASYGTTTFFTSGSSLWRTDGTPAGTIAVHSFSSGIPRVLAATATHVFFLRSTQAASDLWVSDGNSSAMFLQTLPGTSDYVPYVAAVGESIVFTPLDQDLLFWRSDGTPAGTGLLHSASGDPFTSGGPLLTRNGLLYFSGETSTQSGMWASNGTDAGTQLLLSNVVATGMTNVGSLVYYFVDGYPNLQLWKTDFTVPGTNYVTDVSWTLSFNGRTGAAASTFLFHAPGLNEGDEPWRSDGTAAGTTLLVNIQRETGSSYPAGITARGSDAFFAATAPDGSDRAWRSSGSATTTQQIGSMTEPQSFLTLGNDVYFAATTASWLPDLYVCRGPGCTAEQLRDASNNPWHLKPSAVVNDRMLLVDFVTPDLYAISNGSTQPLHLANGIWRVGTAVAAPWNPNLTIFVASTDAGNVLYQTDGTSDGTFPFLPAQLLGASAGNDLAVADSRLIFSSQASSTITALWSSNGSDLVPLHNFTRRSGQRLTPNSLTVLGGLVLFAADDGISGNELWRTDGTFAGTQLVRDIVPGSGSSYPLSYPRSTFARLGNALLFSACTPSSGCELWKSDGTYGGTQMIRDIAPLASGSYPMDLVTIGKLAYFSATDASDVATIVAVMPHGRELWVTDGTPWGTHIVSDLVTGSDSSYPAGLAVAADRVYFRATTPAHGTELYVYLPSAITPVSP